MDTIELNNSTTSSSFIHYISPHTVYFLKEVQSPAVQEGDGKTIKTLDYKFSWPRSEVCYAHFACTTLGGNICGSYGLSVGASQNQSVCLKNVLYEDELGENDAARLELWYLEGTDYHAECYFWCTMDGDLPDEKPSKTVDSTTLKNIVSPFTLINICLVSV